MRFQIVLILVLQVGFCMSDSYWQKWGNFSFKFTFPYDDVDDIEESEHHLDFSAFSSNAVDESVGEIDPNVKEDEGLSTTQLITKYGYPSETHYVTTDDGYILEVHRIPKPGKTPVLLVHGLLDSSATWVLMGPNKGFAYMLSDLQYDIWMANVRGNTYGRNHTTLDPKHAKFWEFTFHEMGIHDIPRTIDYVLAATNITKLHYIGHSQGTTCFWIMCSLLPEYNEKIISMQAMAPAAFLEDCKSPVINFLSFFRSEVSYIFRIIGTHEFLPKNSFLKYFSKYICDEYAIAGTICSQVIFITVGYDSAQLNHTMLPVILGHTPAGSSTKQLLHFAQLKSSGHFRQFDFGYFENYRRYRRFSPPDYPLEKVVAKVAIHYGANDWLTVPADIERLELALPNTIGKFLVKFSEFNHLDFVWGIDARELVYNKVVQVMRAVENGFL